MRTSASTDANCGGAGSGNPASSTWTVPAAPSTHSTAAPANASSGCHEGGQRSAAPAVRVVRLELAAQAERVVQLQQVPRLDELAVVAASRCRSVVPRPPLDELATSRHAHVLESRLDVDTVETRPERVRDRSAALAESALERVEERSERVAAQRRPQWKTEGRSGVGTTRNGTRRLRSSCVVSGHARRKVFRFVPFAPVVRPWHVAKRCSRARTLHRPVRELVAVHVGTPTRDSVGLVGFGAARLPDVPVARERSREALVQGIPSCSSTREGSPTGGGASAATRCPTASPVS